MRVFKSFFVTPGPQIKREELVEKIGEASVKKLETLASTLKKKLRKKEAHVWHINSCFSGGGVADILTVFIRYSDLLGVIQNWVVIGGDDKFFGITPKFHNILHGKSEKVSEDEVRYWEGMNHKNNFSQIMDIKKKKKLPDPDFIVIHDPQPLPLISSLKKALPKTRFIWRDHIMFEESSDSYRLWEYFKPYIQMFDAWVFTKIEFIPPGIKGEKDKIFLIYPSIDPLGTINMALSTEFVQATMKKYGVSMDTHLYLNNTRFDPLKNRYGVLEAFTEAARELKKKGKKINLALIGPLAADNLKFDILMDMKGKAKKLKEEEDIDVLIMGMPSGLPEDLKEREEFVDGLLKSDIDANEFLTLTDEQKKALWEMDQNWKELKHFEIHNLEMNAFQTAAYAIIVLSIEEAFGLACAGAMYHGKPVIASWVGGLRDQGQHQKSLIHVGCDPSTSKFQKDLSEKELRDWIIRLEENPENGGIIGGEAKRVATKRWLNPRHLKDYFDLFNKIS